MKKLLYLLLFIILPFAVISQNIKGNDLKIKKKSRLIGQVTIGSRSFDNSAILTLTATDRGLLIPRLTTAERNAIGSPTNGLMIYNTDAGEFQFFEGVWMSVGGGMGIVDSSFVVLQTDTNKAFNNTNIQFTDSVFFQNPVQIDSPFTVNLAQSTFKGVDATSSNFVIDVTDNVGTKLFRIRNDGNVGIGLDNPTRKFVVSDAFPITLHRPVFTLGNGVVLSFTLNNTLSNSTEYARILGNIGSSVGDNVEATRNGNITFFTATNGSLTERFRIDENGPSTTKLRINNTDFSSTYNLEIESNATDATPLRIYRPFSVLGKGVIFGFGLHNTIGNVTDYASIIAWIGDDAGDNVEATKNGRLTFYTATNGSLTEKVRIDKNGNMGIGTITPNVKLTVIGDIVSNTYNFAPDVQADDDYEIALPDIVALTTGLMVTFTANTANTGGVTLEITRVGLLDAILKLHDQALVTGDIEAGQVVVCVFDGTNWQMISQLAQ